MSRLSVLVADDERPARQKIRRFLADYPDVGPVFEAADGPAALALIREVQPDIVFLDVQMPGLTGAEVVRSLPADSTPHVVFVTAFDRYAVEAFDLSAVDYLLKPFDRERFHRALGRARALVTEAVRRDDLERALRLVSTHRPEPVDRLLVDDGGRTTIVALADVEIFEAARNYVRLVVPPHSWRLRDTLQSLETRLDPRRFARISRSTIVNLDRVCELRPVGHGDCEILMKSGARARLSRRFRDRLDAIKTP